MDRVSVNENDFLKELARVKGKMYKSKNKGNTRIKIYCKKPSYGMVFNGVLHTYTKYEGCGIFDNEVLNPIITKYEYCNMIKENVEKCGLMCSIMKANYLSNEFTVLF